jgi:hypothetical protein
LWREWHAAQQEVERLTLEHEDVTDEAAEAALEFSAGAGWEHLATWRRQQNEIVDHHVKMRRRGIVQPAPRRLEPKIAAALGEAVGKPKRELADAARQNIEAMARAGRVPSPEMLGQLDHLEREARRFQRVPAN